MHAQAVTPYPEQLKALIRSAFERLEAELHQAMPRMASHVLAWMQRLAGSRPLEAYFLHPDAFPMLLLPWWVEETLPGDPDIDFQADLIFSTINIYYAIRLIDNVMDGDAT